MSSLQFYALDTQNGSFVNDVISGTGGLTRTNTDTVYCPDDSNVWQPFASGVVPEYYHNGEWYMPFQHALTNSQIRSYDLSNAEWTKSNTTATLNQTGMRGDTNGASLVTATGANGTCIANAITAASGDHATRWFLKRSTGSGTIEISIDGGSTYTDITLALAVSEALGLWHESVINQTLANPQIGIRIVTSGDAVIVGNAECYTAPATSGSALGIVRLSSPIFTAGSTGSLTETDVYAHIDNHSNSSSLYYFEVAVGAADDDQGNTDQYIPSTNGGAAVNNPCNIANGSLWSAQYRDVALTGTGSTSQVARPLVADEKYQVCSWYDSTANEARFSLDGDISGTGPETDFGDFEAGSVLHITHRQTSANTGVTLLIRNMRRYDIDDLDDGDALEISLMQTTASWGGQNLVRQSRRMDLEVNPSNPWADISAPTISYDSATGICTVEDTDASAIDYVRQLSIPISASTQTLTLRVLVDKDAITTSFPEFYVRLTGNSTQNAIVQLNTSTGAVGTRGANDGETPVGADGGDYWEAIVEITNDSNSLAQVVIQPAYTTTLGNAGVASAQRAIGVYNVELYDGLTAADIEGQAPAYTPGGTASVIEFDTSTQYSGGTLLTAAGKVQTTSVARSYTPVATDVYIAGTLHSATGRMYVTTATPSGSNSFINGILHTETGIRYVETSGGANKWPAGFATADDGTQLVTTSPTTPSSVGGIARDSDGAMST